MAVDFNIEIRRKQLQSLDQFVTSSRDKVESILSCLGWSVDKIQEEQRLFVKCPHDDNHKIPAEKIEDHTDKCATKSAGYDLQEKFMSEPNKLLNESTTKIDTNKKIEILCQAVTQKPYFRTAWNGKDPDPQTHSRLVTTFSSDERLVLYDYSVANTEGPPELPEFDTSTLRKEEGDSSFTKQALMSFERDIKRRSVKYKPVHTNHKNYKEVLRDVIDSQMQQYNEWLDHVKDFKGPRTPELFSTEEHGECIEELGNQNKCPEYIERPNSSVSRFSNHSSSSHDTRHERPSRSSRYYSKFQSDEGVKKQYKKEHHTTHASHISKSGYKYSHREDSQESNSWNKVSPIDMDSSSETYDNTRAHSRDSSIHSSYRYKDNKNNGYKESRSHKSRSNSREWKKRDHSSGSSKHSSRRHRSKDHKSDRHHYREKSGRHRYSHKDT